MLPLCCDVVCGTKSDSWHHVRSGKLQFKTGNWLKFGHEKGGLQQPEVPLRPIVLSPSSKYHFSDITSCRQDRPVREELQALVEVIRETRVKEEEMLDSFDVSSLFTNVPVDEAVHVSSRTGCEVTRHCVTEPPSPLTELQNYWRCARGPPTVAIKKNEKVQQWVHLFLPQWPTSTWSSLKILPSLLPQ